MSAWAAYLLIVLALLLAFEGGFRLSHVKRMKLSSEQRSQVGSVLAALLGVLGFVLGFSFSIVEARFSARRALVIREANAIGTAYLRSNFLPPGEDALSKELLRQYVDLRLQQPDAESFPRLLQESERVHARLWSLASRAADEAPNSIPLGTYINALNEVIDLHEERLSVAVRDRLPSTFLVTLFGAAALAMGVLGLSTGQTGSRNLVASLPFILVLAALLSLIADLDRPEMRTATVGQGAMKDLQRTIRKAPPEFP
ncbi:MAG: hypothetical protein WBV82_16350 [Myxococcaceae bacterium]